MGVRHAGFSREGVRDSMDLGSQWQILERWTHPCLCLPGASSVVKWGQAWGIKVNFGNSCTTYVIFEAIGRGWKGFLCHLWKPLVVELLARSLHLSNAARLTMRYQWPRKSGDFIYVKLIKERRINDPNQRNTKEEAWKGNEEEMPVWKDRTNQNIKWAHCPKWGSLSLHFPS